MTRLILHMRRNKTRGTQAVYPIPLTSQLLRGLGTLKCLNKTGPYNAPWPTWVEQQLYAFLVLCSLGKRASRHHYDEQVCSGEMREKEKCGCSCTVERSRTENVKVVRDRLIWMAHAATWGCVISGPVLQLRAMVMSGSKECLRAISVSVALFQLRSMFILVACDTIECHTEAHGLACHLRTSWCLRAMLPPEP